MQKSDSINELAAALVLAQGQIKVASMNATNPHFRSKYADLQAIWDASRDALQANGLAVSQYTDSLPNGSPALTSVLVHKSGQWMEGTYPLISIKQDAQGFGSALTYAKRYALASILGIVADEDDDAAAASKPPKPSAAPSKQPGGEAYAPEHVKVPPAVDPTRAAAAKSWALGEIPRIKGMTKPALDKFMERFAKTREELKVLDAKTAVELEKALADRLEELFA